MNATTITLTDQRKQFLRPLQVSIALSMSGEFIIFLIFGLILFPAGNWVNKFLWTVVFCGIGMGATLGAFINLFVVQRWQGVKAIIATTLLSIGLLGIACDLLCLSLDRQFQYFGGTIHSDVFLINGMVMATIGGLFGGWLLFTEKGQQLLSRLNI